MKDFIIKTALATLILTSGISSNIQYTETAWASKGTDFKDLTVSHWAYSNILWGVEKNIIKGSVNSKNQRIFRAQAVVTEA